MFDGLLKHFPAAGVDAHGVVVGGHPPSKSTETSIRGVSTETAPLLTRLSAVRRTVQALLAAHPVDVIASHFALYTAPVLDLIGDTPLVVHFHGPWGLESKAEGDSYAKAKMKAAIERIVYRRATLFVVLSTSFREVLSAEFGIPSERIHVVPGGVDPTQFQTLLSRSSARARLQLPESRPTVVAVRRLARRMGLENLIDAWVYIQREVPDALLLIAGKGPIAEELRDRIAGHGLNEHVRLMGFVPDNNLPLLYRSADISILPTQSLEGFGLTTIESLAAGTPVLVTPVGGLPEVVQDLSPRLILPDGNVDSIADGLITALQNQGGLPTPSQCRDYVQSRYSWPSIAEQTRSVYEHLTHARVTPTS